MAEQITINIPQPLYQRVRRLARVRKRPLDDVLESAIQLAEETLSSVADDDILMSQEETAYQAMHAELTSLYADEYVAIHQGQLIDHDSDELALLRRLDSQYPNEIVLMKRVRPLPEPELRFRSPRFVRNES